MATLALASEFLGRYAKLDRVVQRRVEDLAGKCERLSLYELGQMPGLHLETYNNQKDPRARTIRLGDNHRGIVLALEETEQIVLVDVLPHDQADRWMMRNEFKVNAATGALEITDDVAIADQAGRVPEMITAADTAKPLYEHRRDKDFTVLGIDPDLIPTLRLYENDDQLQGLLSVLPQGQADALIMLTGKETVEQIYTHITGSHQPEEHDTEDLSAAITAPASMGTFHVVDGEQELAEMLARPMAHWRVYLHQSQHQAAYKPVYNGPVRVTGGAGTGKTVVAIHRAAALADQLGRHTGRPILFTTFTRNLAQSISHDLEALGGTDLANVVDVLNVDRLAHRIVTEAEGRQPKVAHGDALTRLWEDAIDQLGYDNLTPTFLEQEWQQVVLAHGIASRDEYFTVSRAGRGRRLDRRDRARVWKLIESLTHKLDARGQRTHLQIAATAAGHLTADPVKPYRHVIVDEAQDLHEAQWRLLRAAVEEGPNDMFIVGDSHQRIYDRRSSLSKVGINIRGRSRRLRINYRTTHEILRWSLAVLGDEEFDDLDEGTDDHDVAGYHSFRHGPEPTVIGSESRSAMIDALVEQVSAWIEAGVDPAEVGVTARTHRILEDIAESLRGSGIECFQLGKDLKPGNGVALGTMHRFKGLEYRCVAVADVDDQTLPLRSALTPASADQLQHDREVHMERCLLYVACTRARDDLWVGWAGRPSPFVPVGG